MIHDDIRYCFGVFLLATSLGLNLALIASRNDDWPTIQAPYVDGTEANELLDSGFRIFDPAGYEVEFFLPDGSHHRYADPAPIDSENASAVECAA